MAKSGRRGGLKIHWGQLRVGSNPTPGTDLVWLAAALTAIPKCGDHFVTVMEQYPGRFAAVGASVAVPLLFSAVLMAGLNVEVWERVADPSGAGWWPRAGGVVAGG